MDLPQLAGEWLAQYGYLAIVAIMMLGMLWVPLPEETFLTAVGVFVAKGKLDLVPAVLAAFAGTTLGVTGMYILGRTAGFAVVRRYGKLIRVTPRRIKHAHDWFNRHGKWTLTFAYYIPYIRHINAIVAGTSKIRWSEFALFAYPGGLVWVITFIALGNFLGDQWVRLKPLLGPVTLGASAATIAAVVVYLLWKRKIQRDFRDSEDSKDKTNP